MKRALGPLVFLSLFVAAVICLGIAASSSGIAVGEPAQMDAAHAIGVWFNRIGLGETSFFDQHARDAVWGPIHGHVTVATMLSALVWHVATSGYQWWSELLSLRLGYVLIAALSVPLLYALVAPRWGRRTAVLASAFLAFVPRAMHQASLADPHALTVTGWLLVLVPYARALRARSRRAVLAWSLATGLGLGLAVAISHGALVVLVVLLVHTVWLERSTLRALLREGLFPLPASLLAIVVLAPVVFFASSPWLWHDSAQRIRPMFIQAFSASPDTHATSFAVLSLVTSVPAVTLFAAALGLAVVVGPARLRRWARDEERMCEGAENGLIVVGLLLALAWPWIAPASMHASPPRWLVAVPFIAALAAVGLDRSLNEISSRLSNRSRALRVGILIGVGALSLAVPLAQTLSHPATRSAAFTPLSGGPAWVASSDRLALHDGSPAAALIPSIDSMGRSTLSVFGPEIPNALWEAMRRRGMIRTNLRSVKNPAQADVVIVSGEGGDVLANASRGAKAPKLLATVQRDGVVLLSLYEMTRR